MRVRTQVKAGKIAINHNEGLRIRSAIKAGKIILNHNEALKRRDEAARGRGYAFGFGRK